MNKELCIKVGKWNKSILWCTLKKHKKCPFSFRPLMYIFTKSFIPWNRIDFIYLTFSSYTSRTLRWSSGKSFDNIKEENSNKLTLVFYRINIYVMIKYTKWGGKCTFKAILLYIRVTVVAMDTQKCLLFYCWLTHVVVKYVVIIESFAMDKSHAFSVLLHYICRCQQYGTKLGLHVKCPVLLSNMGNFVFFDRFS